MSDLRALLTFVAYLVTAIVLGALLAGVADAVALDAISGTPLGREAQAAPYIWGAIGFVVLLGGREVFA